jgi:SlyX protein
VTAVARSPLEERVIELESRHLHVENLLEKLNEVLVEQQAAIERLEREVARLREELRAPPEDEVEPPPPHY